MCSLSAAQKHLNERPKPATDKKAFTCPLGPREVDRVEKTTQRLSDTPPPPLHELTPVLGKYHPLTIITTAATTIISNTI